MKFINRSSVVPAAGGKLFHNFIADGKKECRWYILVKGLM